MSYENPDPLEREQAQEDAKRQQAIAQREAEEDLKFVMSSKQGRRFMHRTLASAGIWKTTFNTNAMQMAFGEGKRNQGLMLLSQVMKACPERYSQMLKEQSNDE